MVLNGDNLDGFVIDPIKKTGECNISENIYNMAQTQPIAINSNDFIIFGIYIVNSKKLKTNKIKINFQYDDIQYH